MKHIGKISGSILGFLAGGIYGLIFGFLIGFWVDQKIINIYFQRKKYHAQEIFFRACFLMMGCVAKIDGRVSEEEIEIAQRFMGKFELNASQKKLAVDYFKLGMSGHFNREEIMRELKKNYATQSNMLYWFVEIQLELAYADKKFSEDEKQFLIKLCQELGLSVSEFPPFREESRTEQPAPEVSPLDPYQILKISPEVNNQQLKKAYRILMSKNHPDKLIAQGLPESMLQIATRKTQEVKAAYEEICRARGI